MASEAGVAVAGDSPAGAGSLAARTGARVQSLFGWITRTFENRAVEYGLWAAILIGLVLFTAVRPMYPNYDTAYALVWGDQIAHGHLPDFEVFKTPTPHPLFNLYTAALSFTGNAAIPILLYLSLAMYVALLAGIYRLVQLKISTVAAFATVLVLLTRTDLLAFAFRSMLDIPFLLMIVWAAVLELMRPRRGTAPLVLLTLAGLLRPEAWLLAGIYWLWLAVGIARPGLKLPGEQPSAGRLLAYAGLVASAPVLWVAHDWVIAGEPFYSLTSTRDVAGELNRQKSLPEAIRLLPHYAGASEPIVNPVAGVLGFGLAVYALRARMFMLGALAVTGALTYLLISIAGLSVIPRYLVLTSLVACIGVAFALVGWTQLSGRARQIGIAIAVFAFGLMLVRAPSYLHDAQGLNTSTLQTSVKFSRIYKIVESPRVLRQVRSCPPLIAPTHEVVPVLRYKLEMAKDRVIASTQTTSTPLRGVQMHPTGFLEPLAMTNISHVLRKPWTNFPYPNFHFLAENRAWIVYVSCRA